MAAREVRGMAGIYGKTERMSMKRWMSPFQLPSFQDMSAESGTAEGMQSTLLAPILPTGQCAPLPLKTMSVISMSWPLRLTTSNPKLESCLLESALQSPNRNRDEIVNVVMILSIGSFLEIGSIIVNRERDRDPNTIPAPNRTARGFPGASHRPASNKEGRAEKGD
jgi:hypothetical protein